MQKKPKLDQKSYKYYRTKIIQPSTHSSFHPPISQPSIHLSFTQLSINIHIHSSSVPNPSTHPSTCPFTYSPIHSSIHSSTHLSIHLPIYPLIYPNPYNWQIWIQHWAFHALWPGDTEVNEHKQMPASLSAQEWKQGRPVKEGIMSRWQWSPWLRTFHIHFTHLLWIHWWGGGLGAKGS